MGRRTPLFDLHRQLAARIVDFGGWDMPVHYGSQIEEHHAVRRSAGMFDVSHMCVVDLHGAGSRDLLRRLLANDAGKLRVPGKALYSCMLNADAGVIDDLIVYFLAADSFRLVVNAGTRDKDLRWIREHAREFAVAVSERTDLAILAVQGPQARSRVASVLSGDAAVRALQIQPFFGEQIDDWFVARTGYTGEDGFELMVPSSSAVAVWRKLNAADVASCGLGARDTLRLEAGMNLYGNDMDESTHPFESGLGWTVALEPRDRDFVGRDALQRIAESAAQGQPGRRLIGLLLEDRGVLRSHQQVVLAASAANVPRGEITSGTFSPTLQRSIALARVPASVERRVQVDVRGKLLEARVVRPPFVRFGKVLVESVENER